MPKCNHTYSRLLQENLLFIILWASSPHHVIYSVFQGFQWKTFDYLLSIPCTEKEYQKWSEQRARTCGTTGHELDHEWRFQARAPTTIG